MPYDSSNRDREKQNELLLELRLSKKKIGMLYPILEDFHGNIIDGHHRLKVDNEWPRMRLVNVKTKKSGIVAKLISNTCRRTVSSKEKTEMLDELGDILLKEGVEKGQVSKQLAELTGMSYRWVVMYLPKKYKDYSQSERASSAAKFAAKSTKVLQQLRENPIKNFIEIGRYKNANFMILMIKQPLFERIQKTCNSLQLEPNIFIQNAIEEKIKELSAITKNFNISYKEEVMP